MVAAPFSSKKVTFSGVPSGFVTVTVPLAAGVPTAAAFVTAITLAQKPPPSTPSTNCGKYTTDWAEQITAETKIATIVLRIRVNIVLHFGHESVLTDCVSVVGGSNGRKGRETLHEKMLTL